jgi:CheY-like chemotaxis protein
LARKILLADDSVTAQNMGRKILADAGYEVIAVNNGSAALKKVAELKPDLVILDVYMPGYSGLEVCQRLKESQETSRIPVLLSVGKLEPFKPEEAHRVRADAFIVKPFEASELLSALSKLEDKVVPRAEPSKPGRFARAIAAQEEASRGGAREPSGDDNGWKSRIGFPHEKTAEEKVADEPSIYNQMNRDLRTVVDKPTEHAAPLAEFPEAAQDAVAPVPPNLLNDVTPEEVAAIAAAVAQMQMATAAQDFAQLVPAVSEERSEAKFETQNDNKVDTATEPAPAAPPVPAATESEVPATMAASAESEVAANDGAPRWKAVSVALDSEEASISLENEMRQAYAVFVATEPEQTSAVAVSPEPEPVASPALAAPEQVPSATYSSSSPEPVTETPVALLAPPEPEPSSTFVPDEPVTAAVAQPVVEDHTAFSAVAEPEKLPEVASVPNEPVTAVSDPAPPESSPVESHTPGTAVAQVEANHEPALHQESAPVAEQPVPVVAQAEADVTASSQLHEIQPTPEEPAIAQAAAVGGYATTSYAQILHKAEYEADPKPESEVVKSTAAAWANWRQTRDGAEATAEPVAESNPTASATPEPVPQDSAAMAVAAGAEHIAQEIPTEPAAEPRAENAEELASIVDSVLADLRPKLMAEISRKMSQKK